MKIQSILLGAAFLIPTHTQAMWDKINKAFRNCDEHVIKKALDFGAFGNDLTIGNPLHKAAEHGCDRIIKLLIERGANVHTRTTVTYDTPLHEAALGGHVNAVRMLIAHGASVSDQGFKDETPLHKAARRGNTEVALLLLAKARSTGCGREDLLIGTLNNNKMPAAELVCWSDQVARREKTDSCRMLERILTDKSVRDKALAEFQAKETAEK